MKIHRTKLVIIFVFTFVSFPFLAGCAASPTEVIDSLNSQIETLNQEIEDDSSYENSDTSWIPAEYEAWDSNIAWKWDKRSADCYDCIYWHVQVITKNGCPNGIYASINIYKNDEVVDWTNDSIPYLGPGDKAVLSFKKYGLSGSGSGYQGQLTELNCR